MSLKRYLFLIFATLILVLTALQLASLWWLQQRMNSALIDSSEDLSREMVRLALDEVNIDWEVLDAPAPPLPPEFSARQQRLEAEIEALSDQMEVLGDQYSELHDHLEYPISQQQQAALERQQLALESRRERLHQQLQQRIQAQLQLMELDSQQLAHNGQMVIRHRSDSGDQELVIAGINLPELAQWETGVALHPAVWLSFILLCLSALLVTYWLSHHISRPLAALSSGHRRVAAGDTQVRLEEQGSQEIRETIAGFNAMTRQLAELEQLRQKQQQLQQLAELGEVSRGIAHALRNPLHMIGLALEQLADTDDPKQAALLQTQIRNKMARMDSHIKNLMALTPSKEARQPVLLLPILQDIQLELATHVKQPKIVIKGDIEGITLCGNETELRSILHTLLVNAVEASPAQATVYLVVNSAPDNTPAQLRIEIEDQGTGIDPGVKAQLFQPHVSSKADGAGMGLYIARRLARLHYQGDLTLREKPSGGCIASLILQTTTTDHSQAQGARNE